MLANVDRLFSRSGRVDTNLFNHVHIGESGRDLAVSERVLLVGHLGSKLSSRVLVKKLMPSWGKSLFATVEASLANLRQPAVGREVLEHRKTEFLQGHRAVFQALCLEILYEPS